MDFQGKAFQSKRQHNFITNSARTEVKGETGNDADRHMKLTCDVIFTQMTENRGFKKYGAKAVAATIK